MICTIDCVIEWVAEERKAYLTVLSTRHHTTSVNNATFDGRLQLRNNDRIQLVLVDDKGKEKIEMGYKLNVLDRDTIPYMKRVKSAPVDIPEEVLQFARASISPAVEESNVGQESTVELKAEDRDEEEEEDKGEEEEEDKDGAEEGKDDE